MFKIEIEILFKPWKSLTHRQTDSHRHRDYVSINEYDFSKHMILDLCWPSASIISICVESKDPHTGPLAQFRGDMTNTQTDKLFVSIY